jgi:hypothetical protein
MSNRVHQLRLVVTAVDYDDALRFYRDVLGLPEREVFASQGGRRSSRQAGRLWSWRTRGRRRSSTRSRWVAGSPGMSVSRSKWTTRRP